MSISTRLNIKSTSDNKIKFREAIYLLEVERGHRIYNRDIAKELWPFLDAKLAYARFVYLYYRCKRFEVDDIRRICKVCNCDANFLLNIKSDEHRN